MSKERRLGRGLEALLGRPLGATEQEHAQPAATQGGAPGQELGCVTVSVDQIDRNPYQPRVEFDEASLGELSSSIRAHGMIQPLTVRKHGARFQLIAGERRLRAAMQAGWTQVPVQVREADDREVSEIAIVENLQRKDLNALEKAASFQSYLDRYRCTQDELAGRLGIDRSTISNLIRLLELPAPVQQALRAGTITQGHARALLPLGDDREQLEFCQRVIDEGLSVRAIEQLVQDTIHSADGAEREVAKMASPKAKQSTAKHQLSALEQEFRGALGMKVELKQTANGRGKLVVHFRGHEDFDRLREQLCGKPAKLKKAG